jgi:hypothetical protein
MQTANATAAYLSTMIGAGEQLTQLGETIASQMEQGQ